MNTDDDDDFMTNFLADRFEADVKLVTDRSRAKVGERARYTARCGGYFCKPEYIVLLDVHDAAGRLVAAGINGDAPIKGYAPRAGDLVTFTARLVDWRAYQDGCAPYTFEDMTELSAAA